MHIAKFPGVTTFNAADVFTLKYCLIESGRSFVISFVEKNHRRPSFAAPTSWGDGCPYFTFHGCRIKTRRRQGIFTIENTT